MPRRDLRHPTNEAPEPLKRVVTAAIQLALGCVMLVAIILIAEYVTNPRVLTFDFLFR